MRVTQSIAISSCLQPRRDDVGLTSLFSYPLRKRG